MAGFIIAGSIVSTIGVALFATTSDRDAKWVESLRPVPISDLNAALNVPVKPRSSPSPSPASSSSSSSSAPVTLAAAAPLASPSSESKQGPIPGPPGFPSRYALIQGRVTCSDELRSRLSGDPCCYSAMSMKQKRRDVWSGERVRDNFSNDKSLPIYLKDDVSSVHLQWDEVSRLPLVSAQDKRGWGLAIGQWFMNIQESEKVLPRDHYMFIAGEVVPVKNGTRLAVRNPTVPLPNGRMPPFICSLSTPEKWVADNRRDQWVQKAVGTGIGTIGAGLLGYGIYSVSSRK